MPESDIDNHRKLRKAILTGLVEQRVNPPRTLPNQEIVRILRSYVGLPAAKHRDRLDRTQQGLKFRRELIDILLEKGVVAESDIQVLETDYAALTEHLQTMIKRGRD